MNPVRSQGFSLYHQEITTKVVTTNAQVRSEDFSPHPSEATTKVVTTNVEFGGACYV